MAGYGYKTNRKNKIMQKQHSRKEKIANLKITRDTQQVYTTEDIQVIFSKYCSIIAAPAAFTDKRIYEEFAKPMLGIWQSNLKTTIQVDDNDEPMITEVWPRFKKKGAKPSKYWLSTTGRPVAPFDWNDASIYDYRNQIWIENKTGRLYNKKDHVMKGQIPENLSSYQLKLLDLKAKHVNTDKQNNSSRTIKPNRALGSCANSKETLSTIDALKHYTHISTNICKDRESVTVNGIELTSYQYVIDCDNVENPNRTFKWLCNNPYIKFDIVQMKNQYANNPGSIQALITFKQPLSKRNKKELSEHLLVLMARRCNEICIDLAYNHNGVWQNPCMVDDHEGTHLAHIVAFPKENNVPSDYDEVMAKIKSQTGSYNMSFVKSVLTIAKSGAHKTGVPKTAYQMLRELREGIVKGVKELEFSKHDWAFSPSPEPGNRNNKIGIRIITFLCEYQALFGLISYDDDSFHKCREMLCIAVRNAIDALDWNGDNQWTDAEIMKQVIQVIRATMRMDLQERLRLINKAYARVKATGESKLMKYLGKNTDLSKFKYVSYNNDCYILGVKAALKIQKVGNREQLISQFVGLAELQNSGGLDLVTQLLININYKYTNAEHEKLTLLNIITMLKNTGIIRREDETIYNSLISAVLLVMRAFEADGSMSKHRHSFTITRLNRNKLDKYQSSKEYNEGKAKMMHDSTSTTEIALISSATNLERGYLAATIDTPIFANLTAEQCRKLYADDCKQLLDEMLELVEMIYRKDVTHIASSQDINSHTKLLFITDVKTGEIKVNRCYAKNGGHLTKLAKQIEGRMFSHNINIEYLYNGLDVDMLTITNADTIADNYQKVIRDAYSKNTVESPLDRIYSYYNDYILNGISKMIVKYAAANDMRYDEEFQYEAFDILDDSDWNDLIHKDMYKTLIKTLKGCQTRRARSYKKEFAFNPVSDILTMFENYLNYKFSEVTEYEHHKNEITQKALDTIKAEFNIEDSIAA